MRVRMSFRTLRIHSLDGLLFCKDGIHSVYRDKLNSAPAPTIAVDNVGNGEESPSLPPFRQAVLILLSLAVDDAPAPSHFTVRSQFVDDDAPLPFPIAAEL